MSLIMFERYDSSPNMSSTSLSDNDEDGSRNLLASLVPYTRFDVTPAQWSNSRQGKSNIMRPTSSLASSLPPEILIHILKQLHSSRDIHNSLIVSRCWCECAVELLWHRPALSNVSRFLQLLQVISSENQTFQYANFIRRLNFLNFSREVTDGFFMLLDRCVKLERLTMSNCTEITDNALRHVFPNLINLVVIDLTNITTTSDQTIIALAESAPKLQGLNFGNCRNLTDSSIIALAQNCHLLRRIKLAGLKNITDKAVSTIARSCPLLLEVDLNGCSKITDTAIRDLWIYATHLRELKLGQCTELTDAAFPVSHSRLATSSAGPRSFSTRSSLSSTELPPLKVKRILDHLRMLDLTACHQITDDAVEGIITHAPKIRHLFLGKCSQLTDNAVENISKLGKYLHYLHLGHASSITDRSVTILARSCTRLRYIDLACCPLLTDLSASELAVLPKLKRIGLVRVSNLTDQGVNSLAEGQTSLERIHLSYCDAITAVAIHQLLQRLTKVTHLSLTGIPAFRLPELQRFCRSPPKEFNSSQRAAFCVYSGQGVHDLRRHLADTMFCSVDDQETNFDAQLESDNETNTQTNHMNDYTSTLQLNDYERRHDNLRSEELDISPNNMNHWRLHSRQQPLERSANTYAHYSARPIRLAPPFEELDIGSDVSTPNLSRRGSLESLEAVRDPPRITHIFGQDIVIEQPSSSVAIGIASQNNANKLHNPNGSVLFRTYSEIVETTRVDMQTPDLVFAEIGRGKGEIVAGPGPSTIAQSLGCSENTYVTSQGNSMSHVQLVGQDVNGMSKLHIASVPLPESANHSQQYAISSTDHSLSSSAIQGFQNSIHTMFGSISSDSANRQKHEIGEQDSGHGQNVRRSLRNTLNAAEHYASSLLFGRGSSSNRDISSTPSH